MDKTHTKVSKIRFVLDAKRNTKSRSYFENFTVIQSEQHNIYTHRDITVQYSILFTFRPFKGSCFPKNTTNGTSTCTANKYHKDTSTQETIIQVSNKLQTKTKPSLVPSEIQFTFWTSLFVTVRIHTGNFHFTIFSSR